MFTNSFLCLIPCSRVARSPVHKKHHFSRGYCGRTLSSTSYNHSFEERVQIPATASSLLDLEGVLLSHRVPTLSKFSKHHSRKASSPGRLYMRKLPNSLPQTWAGTPLPSTSADRAPTADCASMRVPSKSSTRFFSDAVDIASQSSQTTRRLSERQRKST